MQRSNQKFIGPVFLSLVVFGSAQIGFAQNRRSFDAAGYFQRLDRNGDERLDKSELNAKAMTYLRRIGINVNDDRIRLRTINKRLEQNEQTNQEQLAQQEKERLNQGLKVPAFGVPPEEHSVDQFGGDSEQVQSVEFSESTLKMVDSVLRRYDRNQDNVIDLEERKQGRWGRPDPNESDLNRDGLLSRDELMRRYHVREQGQARQRDNSDRDGRGRRDDDGQRDERERSGVSGRTTSKSTATRSGSRSNQQDREAYVKYSKSLIGRYDKDNDSRLSKEEWKSVRRPPANADKNKDGFVSQSEYADALMRAAGGKSGSEKSGSAESKKPPSSGDGGRKRSPGIADMTKLDANSDAQVQMHEYASDWDEGKLAEYYAIDKNRDGVITASEWRSK